MKDIYEKTIRTKVTFRLHPDIIKQLKELQEETGLSQAKIIENLVYERKNKNE